jgi:PAS domain S-box-containing protein
MQPGFHHLRIVTILILTTLTLVTVAFIGPLSIQPAQSALEAGHTSQAEYLALQIAAREDHPDIDLVKGQAYRLLAKICAIHSRNSDQIQNLFRSLEYFEKSGPPNEVTEAMRLIGVYYLQMKLSPQANAYFKQVYLRSLHANDSLGQVRVISNLAQVKFEMSQIDSAIQLYHQAIQLAVKKKFREGLVENWCRLSYAYESKGEPVAMLAAMKESIKYTNANTDTLGIIYGDLGLAYMKNGKLDSANLFLEKGFLLINQGANQRQQMIILKLMSELRRKQNRLSESIDLLNRHVALREKLFTSQLQGEMSYAESRHQKMQSALQLVEAENRYRKVWISLIALIGIASTLIFIALGLRSKNRIILRQKEALGEINLQLEQSQQMYRQVFDNGLGLIMTLTLEGKILTVNRAAEYIFQKKREELVGRLLVDVVYPDLTFVFPAYLTDIETKGYSEGWMRVADEHQNHRILWYQNNVIRQSSTEAFVISFAQDQTEIFHAREAAERERRLLQTVMDNSPDIFSILKRDGTVAYMNRSNFFDVKDVIGKTMSHFLPPEQASHFLRKLTHVFDTGEDMEIEESFADKHYVTKLLPIEVLGNTDEVLTINRDVTRRKAVETELKLAKENAEESNRLKTIFLGSLSHEVRTPLQGILGISELMESSHVTEVKRKEFLQIIKRRTLDMQNIIESLLDLASLETGEIKAFPIKTNLSEIVDEVFSNARQDHALVNKPITFQLANQLADDAVVWIDPQHLHTVLKNLIANAMKFTDEGTITLVSEKSQRGYQIRVIDSGIGIPKEKIQHIFEPFRQAHEGFSRSKGGIGLGLSICKKFVELWGGEIFVHSEFGIGSVFSVLIPNPDDRV